MKKKRIDNKLVMNAEYPAGSSVILCWLNEDQREA